MNRLLIIMILILGILPVSSYAEKLVLAERGKTTYVIVKPDTGSVLDGIAVRELAVFLGKATGAEFPIVTVNRAGYYSNRLIVGNGAFARKIFGAKTLDALKYQESIILTKGNDIMMAGQGSHGSSQAVYRFLKEQVGCRWFTPYGDELVPKHKKLEVPQISNRFVPSFAYRNNMEDYNYRQPNSCLYFFRNGLNATTTGFTKSLYPELGEYFNQKDFEMRGPGCHTLYHYIPPTYGSDLMGWPWNKVEYFFESHPEYYSLDANGKRVTTMQLCFSNPGLRKQLTDRLLENIGREGGRGYYNLSAMDWGGCFCYCPDCKALEAKYQTPGGPLIDYLIEACAAIKAKYPNAGLSTLAYRKVQTEKPPVIDGKLPDNLAIVFAPIDDDFRRTFDTHENADTYTNLKNYCKLSDKVIVWYYPMLYNFGLPAGTLDRIVTDIKLMKKTGVMGTFFEHDTMGVYYGNNFADLYTYVLDNLYFNANANVPKLIREFTDYYYGPAAPEARAYLNELNLCRKALPDKIPFDAGEGMLTYLTPEWLKTQQQRFDKMDKLCAGDQRRLDNVGMLRFALDLACLGSKYQAITDGKPGNFPTPELIFNRAKANLEKSLNFRYPATEETSRNIQWNNILPTLEERAKTAQIPQKPGTIQIFAPKKNSTTDPEATLGWARSWKPVFPFKMGVFDDLAQKRLIDKTLTQADIKPGGYNLYLLGTTTLTSMCYIWTEGFYDFRLVEAYERTNPKQAFDVYISLKFEGPTFGTTGVEDRVLCDKFVAVRK